MDVAIVGFGFAGLATLAHLVDRTAKPLRVAVVAPDASGHGLAYGTRNPAHVLNVLADRMGAWAHAPEDFSRWLRDSSTAERCCESLGVPIPGPEDYAPRALFACYLDSVRELTLRHAHEKGVEILWITATADRLTRDGELRTNETLALPRPRVDGIDSLQSLLETIQRTPQLGHDWRVVVDALRPDTPDIWQRFSQSDQAEVARDWSTVWSVHRHRMAPHLADRISEEISTGQLRIAATRQLTATVHDQRLQFDAELPDGTVERLRPAAVIDCTGPELSWSSSRQTLPRRLLQDGICTPHHTGLGIVADDRHQIAERLYAIGSPLTGQLWESIAVPELRDQAATIAAQLGLPRPPR